LTTLIISISGRAIPHLLKTFFKINVYSGYLLKYRKNIFIINLADGKKKTMAFMQIVQKKIPKNVHVALDKNDMKPFIEFIRTIVPPEGFQKARAVIDEL